MNEERVIKKQLLKNMLFTFITFSIIFTVFDLIIYNQISASIYSSIDTELKKSFEQTKIRIDDNEVSTLPPNANQGNNKNIADSNKVSPRLIYVVRDKDGNIINQSNLGSFYENYSSSINFDKNILEQTYTISIENIYTYRGINYKATDSSNNVYYIQILANVDGETQTVENNLKTLIMTTIVMILLSIIASYILSKRTLKPIMEAWNKQTEFVQNASHELRTPLTIIQAKQELLLQEPNKKIIDKSEDINVCLNETRRLSKLIKELMTLARGDSNKLDINKSKVNIDNLIRRVSEPYIDIAKMQKKKVILNLDCNNKLMVDENKISEVLIIVLDNAIKYTSEGDSIAIDTKYKDNKMLLQIKDTGIGISKEGLKHIFDRFYREDKARSRQSGGNGLGLSIADTIVKAHNGTIKIIQNEPKGTIVIIRI